MLIQRKINYEKSINVNCELSIKNSEYNHLNFINHSDSEKQANRQLHTLFSLFHRLH